MQSGKVKRVSSGLTSPDDMVTIRNNHQENISQYTNFELRKAGMVSHEVTHQAVKGDFLREKGGKNWRKPDSLLSKQGLSSGVQI